MEAISVLRCCLGVGATEITVNVEARGDFLDSGGLFALDDLL